MLNEWQVVPRDPITDDEDIERLYELTEGQDVHELADPQASPEGCQLATGWKKQAGRVTTNFYPDLRKPA